MRRRPVSATTRAYTNLTSILHSDERQPVIKTRPCRQTNSIAAAKIVRKIIADNKGSAELQAVLEEPVPNPVNGLLSVLGTGFAFGVWKGVLASHEVELETVSARRWKADLGLNKAGKEGSRLLALQLFPKAAGLLK